MRAYLAIARVDHWFKNVFAVPGVILAVVADSDVDVSRLAPSLMLGLLGLCFTASANYAINELLDAPFDRLHPVKRNRPAARGEVRPLYVAVEWALLAALGLGAGFAVNASTGASLVALLAMGLLYNVPPIRTKDHPYLDVLSESVNNPLRLWTGWALTGSHLIPPLSLILAYWMLGAFFMAVKRLAEWRHIGAEDARAYRPPFRFYDENRLLVSILAYSSAASLFAGMFILRYRIELVLAIPLVAGMFAWYLHVGFKPDSPAMNPERLYRDPGLFAWAALTFGSCCALLWFDLPFLSVLFAPSIPPGP